MSDLNNIQVVLVNTTHQGNIGSSARAMKTMGITNLSLVNPKEVPNDHALALSSNAQDVVLNAKIYTSLTEAIKNSHLVIGLTGRKREFSTQLKTPKEIIPKILDSITQQRQVSLVLGNEQHGLSIEELNLCNNIVTIPGNPAYFSLNLAQAVQILCYEIYVNYAPELKHLINTLPPATHQDLHHLLIKIDDCLLKTNYYKNKNQARLKQRLERILNQANLLHEEVDLLHGIFNHLGKNHG